MEQQYQMNTLQKVAMGASIAIIVSAGIYWAVQIVGVIEFLQLAYGE